MLAHRLRRWPSIETTLGQRLVIDGMCAHCSLTFARLDHEICCSTVYLSLGNVTERVSLAFLPRCSRLNTSPLLQSDA